MKYWNRSDRLCSFCFGSLTMKIVHRLIDWNQVQRAFHSKCQRVKHKKHVFRFKSNIDSFRHWTKIHQLIRDSIVPIEPYISRSLVDSRKQHSQRKDVQRRELFLIIRSNQLSWGLLSSFGFSTRPKSRPTEKECIELRHFKQRKNNSMISRINEETLSWNCSPLLVANNFE